VSQSTIFLIEGDAHGLIFLREDLNVFGYCLFYAEESMKKVQRRKRVGVKFASKDPGVGVLFLSEQKAAIMNSRGR
jgi:hypothetical protein